MRKTLSFLLFLLIFGRLFAQITGETVKIDTVLDNAVKNLTKQILFFPHEKIHLHTDKPYYITGEKIFFRAFLLNALTNEPALASRYVYVELIDPVDSIVDRVKIRPDENNLFHGAITLPEDMQQGMYKIRAYTQYMRNQGESAFFSKQVRISDPQILSIQVESEFLFEEEGKVKAGLRFLDVATKTAIMPKEVKLRLNGERTYTVKPDREGWVNIKLNLPANEIKRVLSVELADNNKFYKQYLHIPFPEGNINVAFYPEGGNLIVGQSSNVAFKALDTDGMAINIAGEIVDSKGNVVTTFKTVHDGMGDFYMNPSPDEDYQAVCKWGDRRFNFDLPETKNNTLALKTTIRDNKLWISVNKPENISTRDHYLLIHCRGFVFYAQEWDANKEFISFNTSDFPTGIQHIVLMTKDLQIVSERLVFLLNDDNGYAAVQTQKDVFGKREKIETGIRLTDNERQPLKGSFSIAVTSDKEVVPDTASGIFSNILLCSELRGYIENPEYYFQRQSRDAAYAADLLMKINGWTRYAVPDALQGKITNPVIPIEMGQEILGNVKSGVFGRTAKEFQVTLMSLSHSFFDQTETDENGRYTFDRFEFPDSTRYVVQALNTKGKRNITIELYVDKETFPGVPAVWEPVDALKSNDRLILDYVTKADLQYSYHNGMRMIQLPEVQITGRREEKKYKSTNYFDPDFAITDEEIEKSHISSIRTLISRLPGVFSSGNSIQVRANAGPPMIMIDDMPITVMDGESVWNVLEMIDINDIGQLDLLKNVENLVVFGAQGANGVIAIHTKRGQINPPQKFFNIKPITLLGYQTPVEFYSPVYETRESINNPQPDLRTTIFWKPNVVTDEEGKADLDFYSADDASSTYSVIIEGVSDDGRLVRYYKKSLITIKE